MGAHPRRAPFAVKQGVIETRRKTGQRELGLGACSYGGLLSDAA